MVPADDDVVDPPPLSSHPVRGTRVRTEGGSGPGTVALPPPFYVPQSSRPGRSPRHECRTHIRDIRGLTSRYPDLYGLTHRWTTYAASGARKSHSRLKWWSDLLRGTRARVCVQSPRPSPREEGFRESWTRGKVGVPYRTGETLPPVVKRILSTPL